MDGERYTVRISDPGEVAAAVPQLLGFHPTESLVLIALGGASGGRVRLTARADLPPDRYAPVVARDVVDRLTTGGPAAAVAAVAVVVSEAPDDGTAGDPGLPHQRLVHELVLACTARRLPLRDVLLVRNGRWWSYDCPHPCCAPGAGTPLPGGVSELAAASVAAGVVVAPDRAALAARLDPADGPAEEGMLRACRDAMAHAAAGISQRGAESYGSQSWAAIVDAARRCRPGAPSEERLSDREVARILAGLSDVAVRDRALSLAVGDDPPAAEILWTECTRRAPTQLAAPPATLLAVSAWLRGDGTMANIALMRALAADPGYRLAHYLVEGLAKCIPPADIRAAVAATVARIEAGPVR
jgi:hypothetical protein